MESEKVFAQKLFVESFLADGSQFYYLRRYREDLTKSSKGFFDSLHEQGLFEDIVFTKDGGKMAVLFMQIKNRLGLWCFDKGKRRRIAKSKIHQL